MLPNYLFALHCRLPLDLGLLTILQCLVVPMSSEALGKVKFWLLEWYVTLCLTLEREIVENNENFLIYKES